MPDIYLWPGATPPEDIILRDPTTAGGATVWTGQASIFGVAVTSTAALLNMVAAASVVGVAVVSAVGDLVGVVHTGAASVTGIAVVTAAARMSFVAAASIAGIAVVNAYSPAPYVPPVTPPPAGSGGGPIGVFLPRKRPARVREEELVLA